MMKLEDLVVEDEVDCLPTLHTDRPMPVMIEVMLKPLELARPFAGPPEPTNLMLDIFDEDDD